jgi:hypothetical protein
LARACGGVIGRWGGGGGSIGNYARRRT